MSSDAIRSTLYAMIFTSMLVAGSWMVAAVGIIIAAICVALEIRDVWQSIPLLTQPTEETTL